MDKVVISLGGSVIVPDEGDAAFLMRLASLLRRLSEEYHICVVCGGGKVARYYISTGRELGMTSEELDNLGIAVTRLNATLLLLALGETAVPAIPRTEEEAARMMDHRGIVIMGGTSPGHTTDAVAALVAEKAKATRIVNATSVDAAYSADPRRFPDATRFTTLTFRKFHDLVDKGTHEAGPSDIFDRLGAEIAMRAGIPVYIVHGRNVEEIENAVRGGAVKGTVVQG